ncbi:glycosyltransferase family 4 protein [Winogradskyella aurantiaca]|uniref:glycosyltransferase family 4 protein n=1 Tax=Winogradskyella aurantiaca TaxID=2219558 RepID=UPI000E1E2212|nr:glycosyltransferase family 1 protein [Winogradskyella aurantiaca]
MKLHINYIFRKRQPQYHSIEGLFNSIADELSKGFKVDCIEMPYPGASLKSLLGNLLSIQKNKNVVYHVTGDINYICLKLGKKSVLTVHDVNSALKGNALKRMLKRYFWFKWPAMKVSVITVISEFTKIELSKLIPNQAHKIRVIPNPVNKMITPNLNKNFNESKPKILLLGTKQNKNLERSLNAIKGMSVELIIIGKLTENQGKLLEEYNLNYENFSSLSFSDVINCYKRSDLLCFPSLYEGFGMPIIEAQGIGRPVITSNFGAMKEVAGNSACLVDPLNIDQIRNAVNKIIKDSVYREDLIQKGLKNVERFQMSRISKLYANIYNEVNQL